jgi:hypothetical protein
MILRKRVVLPPVLGVPGTFEHPATNILAD